MFGAVSGVMTTGVPVIAFGISLPLGVETTSEPNLHLAVKYLQ